MPVRSRRTAVGRPLLLVCALAAAGLLAPSGAVAARAKVGSVYTETNNPAGNQVVAFDRSSDGTLTQAQRVDTGGLGRPSPTCPVPGCQIADSQGALSVTPGRNLVFAVNAGSNTISSFRVTRVGLQLVDQVSSGGVFPQSIDTRGNVLYALNLLSGNIAGFRFNGLGQLTAIPGSVQSLATPGPDGAGAQVSFDRTGRTLAVTERATDLIDTFPVTGGVAGPATSHPAAGAGPFGFAFDNLNHLVASEFADGVASTYQLTPGGGLVALDTKSTAGGAPCWLAVTPDGRFAYVANLASKSIARLRLRPDGSLTLLGVTPTLHSPPGELVQVPADEAISRDGRFLYVLIPGLVGGDVSRIDQYAVRPDGDLGLLGSTPEDMPVSASGLAAF